MQFEDNENEELFRCTCQLRQTVQNLVDKYRSLIVGGAASNNETGLQFDDRAENLSSSRQSTVCFGTAEQSVAATALPSPEYVFSEISSRLSNHRVAGFRRRSCANSTPLLAVCGSPDDNATATADIGDVSASTQALADAVPSGSFPSGIGFGSHGSGANTGVGLSFGMVPAVVHYAGEFVESLVPLSAAGAATSARIMRIPNRQCPVHSHIDQQRFFNQVVGGVGVSTAFEINNNYDTISVSNCWQGLKFASPYSEERTTTAAALATTASVSSSMKTGPEPSPGGKFAYQSTSGPHFRKFVGLFFSFAAWALVVAILGLIIHLLVHRKNY